MPGPQNRCKRVCPVFTNRSVTTVLILVRCSSKTFAEDSSKCSRGPKLPPPDSCQCCSRDCETRLVKALESRLISLSNLH
eukprot:5090856-Amphidinium_carterae.1